MASLDSNPQSTSQESPEESTDCMKPRSGYILVTMSNTPEQSEDSGRVPALQSLMSLFSLLSMFHAMQRKLFENFDQHLVMKNSWIKKIGLKSSAWHKLVEIHY